MLRGRRTRYDRVGLAAAVDGRDARGAGADRRRATGRRATSPSTSPPSSRRWKACTHTTKGAPLHIGGDLRRPRGEGRHPRSPTACRSSRSTIRTRWCRASTRCRPPTGRRSTWCASSFQLMVAIGTAMLGLGLWMLLAWRRRRGVPRSRWFLRAAVLVGPGVGRRARVRVGHDRGRAPTLDRLAGHARARRGHRRAEHPLRLLPVARRLRVHGRVHGDRRCAASRGAPLPAERARAASRTRSRHDARRTCRGA